MKYFRNDRESAIVGGMSIENCVGGVSVFGTESFKVDQDSLDRLEKLQERLGEIQYALVTALRDGVQSEPDLPLKIETVDNPFN